MDVNGFLAAAWSTVQMVGLGPFVQTIGVIISAMIVLALIVRVASR